MTSTDTTANSGTVDSQVLGQAQPQPFSRSTGSPSTSATTTGTSSGQKAQVLMDWHARLAALYRRPGGLDQEAVQASLTAMSEDPSVPAKLRDEANTQLGVMLIDPDLQYFDDFVGRLQNQTEAFILSASAEAVTTANSQAGTTASQPQPQPHPDLHTQARSLAHWSGQLSDPASQAGDRMAGVMLDMGDDDTLPANVREAAYSTFLATLDNAGAQSFPDFFALVQKEANASAGHLAGNAPGGHGGPGGPGGPGGWSIPRPLSPALPVARNFGTVLPSAPGGGAQEFVRHMPVAGAPIGDMRKGPLSDAEAFSLPSRERPAVNPNLTSRIDKTLRYVLKHPELSLSAYAQYVHNSGWSKTAASSRCMVQQAREEIASGLDPANQQVVYDALAEYVSADQTQPFARFATHALRSVPVNPRLLSILAESVKPLVVNNKLPDTLYWSDVEPHVNGPDKRIVQAMFNKPFTDYATAGVVSPEPVDHAIGRPVATAVQQLPNTPTVIPLGGAVHSGDFQQDQPLVKRQRLDNDAFAGRPDVQQAFIPLPLQPLAQPSDIQPMQPMQPTLQPLQPLQTHQPPVLQTFEVVQPAPIAIQPTATGNVLPSLMVEQSLSTLQPQPVAQPQPALLP